MGADRKEPALISALSLGQSGVKAWRRDLFLFSILFLVAFGLRFLFPAADPPWHLSWSQDLSGDPPQYTSGARNHVLFGQWEPLGDLRFVTFSKSALTLFAYPVFLLFGVGRWQATLVAAFMSTLIVVLLALGLRRVFGWRAGFCAGSLLAVSTFATFYGRVTFLEIPLLLFLAGVFFCFCLSRDSLFISGCAGACCALSVFFGKPFGFVGVPALAGGWFNRHWSSPRKTARMFVRPLWGITTGFLVIGLFWFFWVFLPNPNEVRSYYREQSLGLYGAPLGLESLSGFFLQVASLGNDTAYFSRQPVLSLLGSAALVLLGWRLRSPRRPRSPAEKNQLSIYIFLAVWLIVGYLGLMPWNYRPLRYQLLLTFPLCGISGILLWEWWQGAKVQFSRSPRWWFWFFLSGIGWLVNMHILYPRFPRGYAPAQFSEMYVLALLMTAPYFLTALFFLRREKRPPLPPRTRTSWKARRILVLALVLAIVGSDGKRYLAWAVNLPYSLSRASRELGELLEPRAVLSGPYGQVLAVENRLRVVTHNFGLAFNPRFFAQFPITHLALDPSNFEMATKQYPEILADASIVSRFWVRGIPVQIVRVSDAPTTGGHERYRLSAFEQAQALFARGQLDSAQAAVALLRERFPDNSRIFWLQAEVLVRSGRLPEAAAALEQAVRLAPDDYLLIWYLAQVQVQRWQATGNRTMLEPVLRAVNGALQYDPESNDLRRLREWLRSQ